MTALPPKPPVSGLRFSLVRLTYTDSNFIAHIAALNEFNAVTGTTQIAFDAGELVNLIQDSLERKPLLLDGGLVLGGCVMSSPEFVHFSKTRKPLATIENLAALFKHADFKIVFFAESCETQSFLADKHIHTFCRRPDALLGRFLKDNAHLISLCNQYELPPSVLKHFLCEVLKTYPVKIVPLPIVQKTPQKTTQTQHTAQFVWSLP